MALGPDHNSRVVRRLEASVDFEPHMAFDVRGGGRMRSTFAAIAGGVRSFLAPYRQIRLADTAMGSQVKSLRVNSHDAGLWRQSMVNEDHLEPRKSVGHPYNFENTHQLINSVLNSCNQITILNYYRWFSSFSRFSTIDHGIHDFHGDQGFQT